MTTPYEKRFHIPASAVDCFDRLKPSHILDYMQEVAGDHSALLGLSRQELTDRGLFWAVIRHKVQISRLPKAGENITVKTWPMPTTRVAYPRATEGFDEAGNSLFKVISLWVIMDMDSRAMVLPGKSGVDVAGTSFGTELKAPGGLPSGGGSCHTQRPVSFCDLDVNGHMNNTRYLDWLCDLRPAAFHKEHPLKAVTICYMNEAREGQQLQLAWTEGDVLRVDGFVPQTDVSAGHTRIFSAEAEF